MNPVQMLIRALKYVNYAYAIWRASMYPNAI
jgi:hypothetical protein